MKNKREPMPERGASVPDAPRSLKGREERAEWRRVAPILWRAGLLTEADHDALAAYCELRVIYNRAMQRVKDEGEILEASTGGLYQHPSLGIGNRARAAMLQVWKEFGLTPASRANLHVPADAGQKSLAEALFEAVHGVSDGD